MQLKSLFIATMVGTTAIAEAQTYDISSGYLRNNTFSQNCTYGKDSTGNVKAVTNETPYGWDVYANASAHKGVMTTVEYGSGITVCDMPVPAKGMDGGAQGGVAAFSISSDGKYTLLQNVTLPAGTYHLVAASYNTSDQTSITSMLRWKPRKGNFSSKLRTFPKDKWTTDTVTFTLTETTQGDIWAGYSSLKTAATVLYLDWVRLYRDTPLGAADVAVKKEQLQSLITAANEALDTDNSENAQALKTKVAEAQALIDNESASVDALNNMQTELAETTNSYTWTRDIVITADKRYARGTTMAFARMSVSGVDADQIAEQGFAFGTAPLPTVSDGVNEATLSNNGTIYWKQNLTPGTKYYMRPFAKSVTGAISYGEQTMLYTLPKANISYVVRDGGTDEQYNRIKNATVEAVNYWRDLTSMQDVTISVGFVDGVPTADCSYGGYIRVGSNQSYQATGTIMHEMLHGVGVIPWAGTQWAKLILRSSSTNQNGGIYGSGYWLGDRATEAVQFWNNNTTDRMNGDYQHMWPYGINGAHEDTHAKELYIGNGLMIQAMAEDGLETSYYHHAAPYYSKDIEDGRKYYIKAESEDYGRLTRYLVPGRSKALLRTTMTAAEAQLNDSAAWYISFTPENQYYQFTNAATGEKIAYTADGFRMSAAQDADTDLQLMKGRVDVTEGKLRGYWILHPEFRNWSPATLTASSTSATSSTGLNLANDGSGLSQRWLILSAEELPLADASTLGIDYAGVETVAAAKADGVYSINGTLVRHGNSTTGLPKGLYVVGGKKVVVR